jgi:tRNA(Ile)-lysidine synthetase-like protein
MLLTDSRDTVAHAIDESGLLKAADRVLVAVSGGPDSTALLVAMRESGRDVVAAHYDHALKPGSDKVAEQVSMLCARLGVALVTERRDAPLPRGSLQAAARALRYEFLERARLRTGADVVAFAHTADDLVEGVVLHLLRGCGLAGMRGMPAKRGRYVRPLLAVPRSEVVDFLKRRGIVPHQDPSNRDTAFARVRVRLQILPALERDRPGITRRFYAAALKASAINDWLAGRAASVLQNGDLTPVQLARMPEPLAAEVVKQMYIKAGGIQPAMSRAHVDSMIRLAHPGRGGRGVDLPGALRFRIVGDRMEIVPAAANRTARDRTAPRLDVGPCSGCDDPHAAHLRAGVDLSIGYRRPGLRMRPAGGRGTRKVQDIFVDARVPREERDSFPLVFAGDRLAWIPGIAVEADLATHPGQPAVHVAITPMPVRWGIKVASLGKPNSPPGEPS